ncbi:MAG: hypothetical protein Q8N39_07315 [Pelolinea sp.]|nr:hypothetical protein [Pelolinea sp.]
MSRAKRGIPDQRLRRVIAGSGIAFARAMDEDVSRAQRGNPEHGWHPAN